MGENTEDKFGRMEERSLKTEKAQKIAVLITAALLVVLDQTTKSVIESVLNSGLERRMTIFPGLLELSYLENSAAAFGLFGDIIWLVILLTVVVACLIVAGLFRYKQHSFFSYAASTLLLAGGVGNLVDRMTRGYVVDFIHVMFFDYIFNVADCCVTIGAVCLVIHCLLCAYREKKAGNFPETPEA